jgi:hypothetical protein
MVKEKLSFFLLNCLRSISLLQARQDMAQMKEVAGSMAKRFSGMAAKFMDDFDRY